MNRNNKSHIHQTGTIDDLLDPGKRPVSKLWRNLFVVFLLLFILGLIVYILILSRGLYILPIQQRVFWGNLIANFVFWIGIAHAGTFISAILLLLKQDWRMGINRFAEAMTLISIVMSAFFIILHLGKPALVYYIFPITNKTSFYLLNFNSALNWDFYAILTYFIVSCLFFHIGFLPDLAAMRDKYPGGFRKKVLRFLALGWTSSQLQWINQQKMLYILAGIATPLVISVHSIVSFDFAVTCNPSWNTSLYPIYFVIGALFSGFAMVSVLAYITSKIQGLDKYIHSTHYDNMSKIMLTTSLLLFLIVINELLHIFLYGNAADRQAWLEKFTGPHALIYILSLLLTLFVPQFFWKEKNRKEGKRTMIISLAVLAGMWLERFAIVITSAQYGHLSSSWHTYKINIASLAITAGACGFLMICYLLFIRFLPALSVYEIRKTERSSAND